VEQLPSVIESPKNTMAREVGAASTWISLRNKRLVPSRDWLELRMA
jgi:hypothetical protein